MHAATWVIVAVVLVSVGCGAPQPVTSSAAPQARAAEPPRTCDAEAGTDTDVAGEPDWRRYADYSEWTDDEGCLVRIDVLAERPGPEHCGWEDARVLITGRPVGERYTDQASSVTYVRDPDGVFERPRLAEGFAADAELPSTAVDTGYRRGSVQLWLDAPTRAAYLVDGDTVERWPRGHDPICG